MEIIRKAPETMTAKQRVLNTIHFEKTDRVPMDFSTNPGILEKLYDAFSIRDRNYVTLLEALGVDFRSSWPHYRGPLLYPEIPGCHVDPEYGFYTRWVPNGSGGYNDFCNFPLKDADCELVARFPVPSPDDYDYAFSLSELKRFQDYGVYVGHAGIGDIINSIGRVMGMEDTLVNLYTGDDATMELVRRKCGLELAVLERILDKGKGYIDFVSLGEDLGTQKGPMISLEMYRTVLKPFHKQFIDMAKSYGLPVMIHSCGSSSWVFEDFIEMGVDMVDTLQPEAANMAPAYLKQQFGGRLSFHGCISTAGPLAYGSAEDVRKNVRETLEIMMPGGGYHLAPTHMIQDNTPVENVIAMYQTAHDCGRY